MATGSRPLPLPFARSVALLHGPDRPFPAEAGGPIVLASVLQRAYNLADAFWVDRLGVGEFLLVILMIAIGIGVGIAGSTLVAQTSAHAIARWSIKSLR